MIPIAVLALITEALKLVNNLIEGVPVELRQAEALRWFATFWPLNKRLLKLIGVDDETIAQIEELAKFKK